MVDAPDRGGQVGVRLSILDARKMSGRAVDFFGEVLSAARSLHELGVLEVHSDAPMEQLAQLLRAQGFQLEQARTEHAWVLRVGRAPPPPLEDLSSLEPPLPAKRVLEAAAALEPGAVYLALLPRYPRFLAPHLENRGLEWVIGIRPDTTAVLWLRTNR
ncbi:MAG: DUF2249 domain-containing protein [Myxococcales bacterium]|nr:DUF2249 domain-containing protein [Myxococcales bacterium]